MRGHRDIHALQHGQEHHIRHRLGQLRAREDERGVEPELPHFGDDGLRAIRQRHPVFTTGFHAVGWDCPDCGCSIDFGPLGKQGFRSSGRGQDQELEGEPGDSASTITSLQALNEGRDVRIGHRLVMLLLAGLLRQPPFDGINRVPIAAMPGRLGPVEDRRQPLPYPSRGFGLVEPDR